ncbi:MauE/DoxX family redox-associated membrane protein [Dactylosporangium sp. NPDC051484]|uniref:MauE/DoxX family redox-associated membrane protein n=1 Tax=Dactylosporangium sp. NPDC051484 TaxID=3154942 RepID=UPI00344D5CCF
MVYGIVVCRCLLVVVFGVSAISKGRNGAAFRDFVASIMAVGLTRRKLAQSTAVLVICAEVAVSLGMLTSFGGVAVYWLALLLVAIFSGVIAYAIRHAPSASCHDEPCASLDALAAERVTARLTEMRAGRTSIVVSHRLAALRGADKIVVLDGGIVDAEGTHDELMTAGGRYRDMFTAQASAYQDDRVAVGPVGGSEQ